MFLDYGARTKTKADYFDRVVHETGFFQPCVHPQIGIRQIQVDSFPEIGYSLCVKILIK